MPPWELITGGAAAVVILTWITFTLWKAYGLRVDEAITSRDATIARLIEERNLALAGWREQTSLTNAAVAAFAEERRDRNARHRQADGS